MQTEIPHAGCINWGTILIKLVFNYFTWISNIYSSHEKSVFLDSLLHSMLYFWVLSVVYTLVAISSHRCFESCNKTHLSIPNVCSNSLNKDFINLLLFNMTCVVLFKFNTKHIEHVMGRRQYKCGGYKSIVFLWALETSTFTYIGYFKKQLWTPHFVKQFVSRTAVKFPFYCSAIILLRCQVRIAYF